MPLIRKKIVIVESIWGSQRILAEIISQFDSSLQVDNLSAGLFMAKYLSYAIQPQLPSLIIMGYAPPLLDTPAILELMKSKEIFNGITKVVLLDFGLGQFEVDWIAAGATMVFQKPARPSELKAIIRNILTEAKMYQNKGAS